MENNITQIDLRFEDAQDLIAVNDRNITDLLNLHLGLKQDHLDLTDSFTSFVETEFKNLEEDFTEAKNSIDSSLEHLDEEVLTTQSSVTTLGESLTQSLEETADYLSTEDSKIMEYAVEVDSSLQETQVILTAAESNISIHTSTLNSVEENLDSHDSSLNTLTAITKSNEEFTRTVELEVESNAEEIEKLDSLTEENSESIEKVEKDLVSEVKDLEKALEDSESGLDSEIKSVEGELLLHKESANDDFDEIDQGMDLILDSLKDLELDLKEEIDSIRVDEVTFDYTMHSSYFTLSSDRRTVTNDNDRWGAALVNYPLEKDHIYYINFLYIRGTVMFGVAPSDIDLDDHFSYTGFAYESEGHYHLNEDSYRIHADELTPFDSFGLVVNRKEGYFEVYINGERVEIIENDLLDSDVSLFPACGIEEGEASIYTVESRE